MNYDLRKVIGEIPDDLCIDTVYDRLNVEGNGRLSLVNLNREINALSIEKNLPPIDIKVIVGVVDMAVSYSSLNIAYRTLFMLFNLQELIVVVMEMF
jgi:hypothetical protein